MFINYNNIREDDITIDVRTSEEFNKNTIFEYNIPIINKDEHKKLKKAPFLAIPIILKGLINNREEIKNQLLFFSYFNEKRIIVGCSKGRLRSPIMYFYAKTLGINVKVLKKGIKTYIITEEIQCN